MIGIYIRILRKKKKMSQEMLAGLLDVSRQTVAKWENEEVLPDNQKCQLLADIFEVTLDQLTEGIQPSSIQQAVNTILDNSCYLKNAQKLAEDIQSTGGPEEAASVILAKISDRVIE